VAFSPAGDAVAVAHYNSPWITVFPWVDGATGTKYANPVGLAFDDSYAYSVAFSPDGAFIAIVNLLYSPYIWVYPWSPSTGFGTKVSNPATSLAGANAVAFSPDGDAIAVAEGGAGDRIAAYAWSSSGFGARYSAPGTLPANTTYVVAFGESA
jgi:sugar lactone lactonase YvrE